MPSRQNATGLSDDLFPSSRPGEGCCTRNARWPQWLAAAVLAAGLLLSWTFLHAAGAYDGDLPQVRCDGKRLIFGWHGGAPHHVDVSSLVRASSLDVVRVLAAEHVGELDYFVV